ncbi:hypothetical protein Cni_G24674 [Canna indica]|uniref:Uncharacterized protein n=1 Tax=Canna indica TaxID=4628 RepID=A0AAQ3KZD5_9LILI|nr:hypothetical protein Cni_G24674 [Canna indica]
MMTWSKYYFQCNYCLLCGVDHQLLEDPEIRMLQVSVAFPSCSCTCITVLNLCMGKDANGKGKRPKGLILKTLERCRSIAGPRKQQMPPEGCFSVFVGPQRERFVIRTECVNHPLFRMLLEEAEMEFGYANSGPLELPCHVEVFREVMREMEEEEEEVEAVETTLCNFGRGHAGYRQLIK